jgi:hypothetical protein
VSNRRIVSSALLVAVCATVVVVGVANAGKEPEARVEAPLTQPAEFRSTLEQILEQARLMAPSQERSALPPVSTPAGWACPGTEGVQNIHVRLSPPPDYFAQGKAVGMSDADARAYVAEMAAVEKAMQEQMLATVATLPPPPCP